MDDSIYIMILLLKSDKGFGSGKKKNISWIFVQNPMQIDLVQY